MKNVLIILLLMVSVSIAQFQSYDAPIAPTAKTLVDADYIKLVDNFQSGNSATATMLATGIEQGTVQVFFSQLKDIERFAIRKMNRIADSIDEIVPTIDTETKLKNMIKNKFLLTDAVSAYIVATILKYSKSTKDGSFATYRDAIILKVN